MDGKDENAFKLDKVGPTFSSFNAMLAKLTQKIIMVTDLLWNLFDIFFITLHSGVFCVCVKILRKDFNTELT